MKRILVVGNGKSGSWKIRGEQLGAAIGATVDPFAERGLKGYDLVIVVKRPKPTVLQAIRAAGIPIVWDIVDAWPQPVGNEWDEQKCLTWLDNAVRAMSPVGVVAATNQMRRDLKTGSVLRLPHHARPGLKINPIRKHVSTIGYEGGQHYLGKWEQLLREECSHRGWQFVLQPANLADLDIVIALRDCGGYAPQNWKSNVKLANAQGSGTPIILSPEEGYKDTLCGVERWVNTSEHLFDALRQLKPHDVRIDAHEKLRAATVTLDAVAATYKDWLERL